MATKQATRPQRQKLADEISYWNIVLYGDSGVGKTVFGGQDNKVLFVAPEDVGRNSGTLSAARQGSSAEKIAVDTWDDMTNFCSWYEDHPEELKDTNVVVIDSLPEMQRLAREYILRETRQEKIRKDQDPDKMQLQDYGTMHELVENLVRNLNDLPVNILYTSTPKKVEDADKNEFLVPDIQGKGDYGMAMKIVALMTCYGYMRVEIHEVPDPTEENPEKTKKVKRRVIYWEDTGTIRGKDRTNSLAPFTVNLTLQQMRLAIAGKMKRNHDGKMVKVGSETSPPAKKVATKPVKSTAAQASPRPENKVSSGVASNSVTMSNTTAGEVGVEVQKEGAKENNLDAVEA